VERPGAKFELEVYKEFIINIQRFKYELPPCKSSIFPPLLIYRFPSRETFDSSETRMAKDLMV
jgi:hypothetical protein